MERIKWTRLLLTGLSAFILILGFSNSALATDAQTLERLERIIKQQQAQIEAQSTAIEDLKNQVEALKQSPGVTAASPEGEKEKPLTVTSGNTKANVQLYGQVNRGVLYSNDGNKDYWYQVDNDNSSTRIGLLGSIKASENMEVGTKIELQFESNSSSAVDQNNQRNVGPNNFTKRHLDIFFKHNQFGKFYVGYGSTASDNTSEVDFSGTTVVGYSSISDMAGGQLFYDDDMDELSDTTIGNVFTNMDGLGRDERLRYDTPSFAGFVGSGSWIADGGGDLALNYAAKFDSLKLAAAVAYANPGSSSDSMDQQFNGSLALLHDSGFNIALAGGIREHKDDDRDDGKFFYSKLGYKAEICPLGTTAFAIDYGHNEDINFNNDKADTVGAMMVQYFRDWATEFYLGYRYHTLDRDDVDYNDINTVLSGFRVKF